MSGVRTEAITRTRNEVIEAAIKRGLVEGWQYVYAWDTYAEGRFTFFAGPAPPGDDFCNRVTRYELGKGIVLSTRDTWKAKP
jgi:hypothetical protein